MLQQEQTSLKRHIPCLMAITNGSLRGEVLFESVRAVLSGGMDAIQVREKTLSAADLFLLVKELKPICREQGALLIVNGRADVALAAGADGVHLGGSSLLPRQVRQLAGRDFIIGFSAHSPEDLSDLEGADYATVSPVYDSICKPGARTLGTAGLAELSSLFMIPVLALGGITAGRMSEVAAGGAVGAAFMSALFSSAQPQAAAAAIAGAWRAANKAAARR